VQFSVADTFQSSELGAVGIIQPEAVKVCFIIWIKNCVRGSNLPRT
jgi:hypothetical protein